MTKNRRPSRITIIIFTAAVLVLGAGTAIAVWPGTATRSPARTASLHADHFSYDGVNNLVANSDAVVLGDVTASAAGAITPTPTGADGSAGPGIPHTDYSVAPREVFKGSASVGSTYTVALLGGATSDNSFEVEGVPVLTTGSRYVFFLTHGDDGKYYPLAAGAAIASLGSDSKYHLGDGVTAGSALTFSLDEVRHPTPPDHLRLALDGPSRTVIDGDVQDGSLSVHTTGGVPDAVTGTVLVQGSTIDLKVAIAGRKASGDITIDGVTYNLKGSDPVIVNGKSLRINGPLTQGSRRAAMQLTVTDQ